jgi:hypothetical protein
MLIERPEGKRPHGRFRREYGIILKWVLEKYVADIWTVFNYHMIGNEKLASIKA